MKKAILIAASLLIVGTTFGHGNGWSKDNKNSSENSSQNWQQMNTWRQVMHDTKVDVENTEKGVSLEIIMPSSEAQASVTSDFKLSQENLAAYFESVAVSLEDREKGWLISFTASDDDLIKRLQHSGRGLWYEFIQQKMAGFMNSNRGNSPMGGHHSMGNYNGHMGQGHGMRGNNNGHMGQGGGNYQGCQGGNPGMYQGNSQNSSKN